MQTKYNFRMEANSCPKVVVADLDTKPFLHKQTVHVKQVNQLQFMQIIYHIYSVIRWFTLPNKLLQICRTVCVFSYRMGFSLPSSILQNRSRCL